MNALAHAIRRQDVGLMCRVLFQAELPPGQQDIAREIAFDLHKRTIISAYTQYGKSYAVADGVLLYSLLNTDKTICLIAPLQDQTSIIRSYLSDHMLRCPLFEQIIPRRLRGAARLQNEFNKRRVKLTNGVKILTFSAEGKADRAMGWGGNKIIIDERCMIPDDVFRAKIMRMLGAHPDNTLIELLNPWTKNNLAYHHWIDPGWHKIHIPWQQGVQEGRISQEFIDEQRATLTPIEFTILYASEFPDDTEDTLNRWEWIQAALARKHAAPQEPPTVEYGFDVAEMGRDLSVLQKISRDGPRITQLAVWSWGKRDIMPSVAEAIAHIGEDKAAPVKVDATGVGSGAYSRLRELGYNAIAVKGGTTPARQRDRDRFEHTKDFVHWQLREALERGDLSLQDHGPTIKELNALKYEISSAGKIRVLKPEDKSPDYADALALACYRASPGILLGGDASVLFNPQE